jgi:hypothetical protein
MFERYLMPIDNSIMPIEIKVLIDGKQFGELVDIERYACGTLDGECDTDIWEMTFCDRKTKIVYCSKVIYTDGKIYPTMEHTSFYTSMNKGFIHRFKDGEYVGQETIPLDKELVERVISKAGAKEVA